MSSALPVRGLVALFATVLLWSSFALSTRGIGETSLTTVDVAFVRFATPLVILAPLIPRAVRQLRHEQRRTIAMVLLGGVPHFLLFALGARMTSAGLTGLLVPGTVPLFVTLLLVRRRTDLPARRVIALGAIVVGVVASALLIHTYASLAGILVLVFAGAVWAVYTLDLQRTGLNITSTILVVCGFSATTCAVLALTHAMPTHLMAGTARAGDVLLFVVVQGLGTGVASTLCYAVAVRCLGGSIASVAGALSPVVTAVVAVPLLHEPLTAGLAVSLACIVTGVLLFNLPRTASERVAMRAAGAWRRAHAATRVRQRAPRQI